MALTVTHTFHIFQLLSTGGNTLLEVDSMRFRVSYALQRNIIGPQGFEPCENTLLLTLYSAPSSHLTYESFSTRLPIKRMPCVAQILCNLPRSFLASSNALAHGRGYPTFLYLPALGRVRCAAPARASTNQGRLPCPTCVPLSGSFWGIAYAEHG